MKVERAVFSSLPTIGNVTKQQVSSRSQLESMIRFLLCKKDPPFAISQSVLRTIYEAKKREQEELHPIRALPQTLLSGFIAGSVSWYQKESSVFSCFVAFTSLRATIEIIRRVVQLTFPNISPLKTRTLATVAITPIIWYAAKELGYPQGNLFLSTAAGNLLFFFIPVLLQNTSKRTHT